MKTYFVNRFSVFVPGKIWNLSKSMGISESIIQKDRMNLSTKISCISASLDFFHFHANSRGKGFHRKKRVSVIAPPHSCKT